MKKLSPFITDAKTSKTLIDVANKHLSSPMNGQVFGNDMSSVNTQSQDVCQFKLATEWKEFSPKNYAASGEKFLFLQTGAEKRSHLTTIYSHGECPASTKDSIIYATRRADRWVLLPTGEGGGRVDSSDQRIRLVQPKELFPACEYKSILNVYGCLLEYSDDGTTWIPAGTFHIEENWFLRNFANPGQNAPRKYWRINLGGYSNNPNLEDDRGFHSFGRLWNTIFTIHRTVEATAIVNDVEYIFEASVKDWQINTTHSVDVQLFYLDR